MARFNKFVPHGHEHIHISEPEDNADFSNGEADFRAHTQNEVGKFPSQDGFSGLGASPDGHIHHIGHRYATVYEHVHAEQSGDDSVAWEHTDDITSFPAAQELQFDSPEGPGTIGDDTISTISDGVPLYITPLVGSHTPDSPSSTEESNTTTSAFASYVTMGNPDDDSHMGAHFTQQPISPYYQPEEEPVDSVAYPKKLNRYYCRKVQHPCYQNKKARDGFSREQDRNRHEVNCHPDKDNPSDKAKCPHCNIRRRKDNLGEHWRESCPANPNRKRR